MVVGKQAHTQNLHSEDQSRLAVRNGKKSPGQETCLGDWGRLLNVDREVLFIEGSLLTAVFVETGAMPVPTKLRNPTICG